MQNLHTTMDMSEKIIKVAIFSTMFLYEICGEKINGCFEVVCGPGSNFFSGLFDPDPYFSRESYPRIMGQSYS